MLDLAQNEFVQEKVTEAARLAFSNSFISINLLPAIIGTGLILLLAVPLLDLILRPAADESGYGAPAAEYGAPASEYGAPSSHYRSVSFRSYRSLLALDKSDCGEPISGLSDLMASFIRLWITTRSPALCRTKALHQSPPSLLPQIILHHVPSPAPPDSTPQDAGYEELTERLQNLADPIISRLSQSAADW